MRDGTELRVIAEVDWRFLLPSGSCSPTRRMIVAGLTADECRSLEGFGIAESVCPHGVSSETADVVAVIRDVGVDPTAVAAGVRCGGCVFWRVNEGRIRGLRRLRRVERELRSSGLGQVTRYWEPHGLGLPRAFVPLDARGAATWYLRRYGRGETARRRALTGFMRVFARWCPSVLTLLSGRLSLTATSNPGAAAAVLSAPDLADHAIDSFPLLLASGDALGRIAVFPFNAAQLEPSIVLKVSRPTHRATRTEREQRVLRVLAAEAGEAGRSVPSAHGVVRCQDAEVGWESCAPGRPLDLLVRRWPGHIAGQQRLLATCLDWLTRFTDASSRPAVWDNTMAGIWVDAPFERSLPLVDTVATTVDLFDNVGRDSAALNGVDVPEVWVHWGFRDGNIFVDGDRVTVIDWEAAGRGPPLIDLLDVVLWWAAAVCGTSEAAVVDRVLLGHTDPVSRTVSGAIDSYVERTHVDPRLVPALVVARCAIRAASRAEHDRRLNISATNPYVDVLHVLGRRHEALTRLGRC
jgi:hypothetical protein